MVGWQGSVQGLSRRQIWTGTFKHGWDVEGLKTDRQKHADLWTLTDFDTWTCTDDKEYWPPSKQLGLPVCSRLAHRTDGAGSLRCGSDLCRLPAEPGRTAARVSAAEPHAMSTAPAGKTASGQQTMLLGVYTICKASPCFLISCCFYLLLMLLLLTQTQHSIFTSSSITAESCHACTPLPWVTFLNTNTVLTP